MTITPLYSESAPVAQQDAVATIDVPTKEPQGIERTMLAQDKIYVVLAVVLIIWFGIVALLYRTDRRIAALEADLEAARLSAD
jgi:hypothetical protein